MNAIEFIIVICFILWFLRDAPEIKPKRKRKTKYHESKKH